MTEQEVREISPHLVEAVGEITQNPTGCAGKGTTFFVELPAHGS